MDIPEPDADITSVIGTTTPGDVKKYFTGAARTIDRTYGGMVDRIGVEMDSVAGAISSVGSAAQSALSDATTDTGRVIDKTATGAELQIATVASDAGFTIATLGGKYGLGTSQVASDTPVYDLYNGVPSTCDAGCPDGQTIVRVSENPDVYRCYFNVIREADTIRPTPDAPYTYHPVTYDFWLNKDNSDCGPDTSPVRTDPIIVPPDVPPIIVPPDVPPITTTPICPTVAPQCPAPCPLPYACCDGESPVERVIWFCVPSGCLESVRMSGCIAPFLEDGTTISDLLAGISPYLFSQIGSMGSNGIATADEYGDSESS